MKVRKASTSTRRDELLEVGQRIEIPDDHVHADDVTIAVVEGEDGGRGVMLQVGAKVAILTADQAMQIQDGLLRAAADAYMNPARWGHTH